MTADRQSTALRFIPSTRVGCSDEPAETTRHLTDTEPGETTRDRDAAPSLRVKTSALLRSAPTPHVAAMRAIAAATRSEGVTP